MDAPPNSDQADRLAISALRDAWVAAVARGDARALADLVTDDYEVWAHATPALAGPDVVVTAMSAAMARTAHSPSWRGWPLALCTRHDQRASTGTGLTT